MKQVDKNFNKLHLSYLNPDEAENMTPIHNYGTPNEFDDPSVMHNPRGNMSTNTIQMLDAQLGPPKRERKRPYQTPAEDPDMMNTLDHLQADESVTVMNQNQDPEEMKRFYKEFCFAVMRNKNPSPLTGQEEVNVYDILIEMQMIPSSGINSPRKGLRKKFTIPVSPSTGIIYEKSI